jgi:hypothetical protein
MRGMRRRAGAGGAARPSAPETAPTFGPPAMRVLELPPLPNGAEAHAPRIAVFANPWPGAVAVHRATEGGGFRRVATISGPATIGRLATPLAPGPLGVLDRAHTFEVSLFGGALQALPDIDVLGGGNLAAVRAGNGEWEVLQFVRAELVGERRYRLARLLRGQGGSEAALAAGAGAGADFVLLNAAVTPLPLSPDEIGLPLLCRFGPAEDDHAAPTFLQATITAEGRGLEPFSPVHLRARRDPATGDVAISWIRRTRIGGDGWGAEPPLHEEREAYRLDIHDGGAVRRSVEVGAPAYLYGAAEQTADFGALPDALTLGVAQLSAAVGAGTPLLETLHV